MEAEHAAEVDELLAYMDEEEEEEEEEEPEPSYALVQPALDTDVMDNSDDDRS